MGKDVKMAKAKRRKTNTSSKTSSKSRKKQNKIDIDLAVVSMIVISILLTVLIYTSSGYMGKTLSPLLGGLMGWMKYILPIGTFAIAINLACEKKETLIPKLMQYAIFLVCIASIMCTFQISKGTINIEREFGDILQQAYELGQKNIGGGAIRNDCNYSNSKYAWRNRSSYFSNWNRNNCTYIYV